MASSTPLSTAVAPAPGNTQYSTLEVDQSRWLENDANAAPIVGQDPKNEKIVGYNDVGKIALFGDQDSKEEKIISHDDDGKQAVVADVYNVLSESSESLRPIEERKIFGLRRKNSLCCCP